MKFLRPRPDLAKEQEAREYAAAAERRRLLELISLVRGIVETPLDPAPRLVTSDWLEDNMDLAPSPDTLKRLLAGLRAPDGVVALYPGWPAGAGKVFVRVRYDKYVRKHWREDGEFYLQGQMDLLVHTPPLTELPARDFLADPSWVQLHEAMAPKWVQLHGGIIASGTTLWSHDAFLFHNGLWIPEREAVMLWRKGLWQ